LAIRLCKMRRRTSYRMPMGSPQKETRRKAERKGAKAERKGAKVERALERERRRRVRAARDARSDSDTPEVAPPPAAPSRPRPTR